VVQAYFENFSIPLRDAGIPVHHVRGNHDKRAARRGSALWCFAGYGTQVHEQVEVWTTQPKMNEWVNFVFAPWVYPEEVLGAKSAEEDQAAWHKRYLGEVHRLVADNFQPMASYNILVAHCRYAGAVMGGGRVCPADEGMVLSPELLGSFSDLHLGDIHKRQEFPLGNGGYTGALSQEGLDEAGNPCGVEIVRLDDNGQIERTWHECPHARRYEDIWVDEETEAQEMAPPSSGVNPHRNSNHAHPLDPFRQRRQV
jgi:DNA repair exonuclease SbcCD nuclease subunit